jgi:hypothetical protein
MCSRSFVLSGDREVTIGSRETNLEENAESQYIVEQIWIRKDRLWDITVAYSVSVVYPNELSCSPICNQV